MKHYYFIKYILCGFLLVMTLATMAASDLYPFTTVQKQQQFNRLVMQFRCLVCQNETLADSNAPLAMDLKNDVYKLVEQNQSDNEIKDYLVSRYGEFVLFKPLYEARTYLLWFMPFVFLAIGFVVWWRIIKISRGKSR